LHKAAVAHGPMRVCCRYCSEWKPTILSRWGFLETCSSPKSHGLLSVSPFWIAMKLEEAPFVSLRQHFCPCIEQPEPSAHKDCHGSTSPCLETTKWPPAKAPNDTRCWDGHLGVYFIFWAKPHQRLFIVVLYCFILLLCLEHWYYEHLWTLEICSLIAKAQFHFFGGRHPQSQSTRLAEHRAALRISVGSISSSFRATAFEQRLGSSSILDTLSGWRNGVSFLQKLICNH